MAHDIRWQQMLAQCKNNIQNQIAPLLKNLGQSQPDLGIGAGGDPIRQVDLVAEKTIVNTLRKHKISFTLISEESGVKEYGKTPCEHFVTADPIDGTTNLIRGIPFYATSIAVSTEPILNAIHTALVADLYHGISYMAQKGKGAYRNDQKIAPSETSSLKEALIGMDLNTYKIEKIVPHITRLVKRTKHVRHLGANALELCYVADGTTDGFIDIRGKLRSTDTAAACLIIKEAGAKITTPEGKPLSIKLDPKHTVSFIAAANPKIHKTILNMIKIKKEVQ